MLDLDPNRPAATPRPASTVLVLRDDEGSLSVYVIVRHPKSGFMGGVVAFPGGKVDAADDAPSLAGVSTSLSPRFADFGADLPASPAALAMAAARECLEEAAILPVEAPPLTDEEAQGLRARLEGGAPLVDELRALRRKVDLGALAPFARWVTPVAEPRRFDACFFLLRCPDGQEGAFDPHETTAGEWAKPRDLLARFECAELMIAPPTLRCLELLATCADVDEALALAGRQNLRPVCPHLAMVGDTPALVLPGDPLHPEREPIVAGPSRFVLRDGRFRGEPALEKTGYLPSR